MIKLKEIKVAWKNLKVLKHLFDKIKKKSCSYNLLLY